MSLDKSVEHGKERRRKLKGAKAWDRSCRNNGRCSHCEDNRTHNTKRRKVESRYDCEDCYDTGCICGKNGCDGCCNCTRPM